MPDSYRIGALSRRTGFSTVVLRAWERRYGLLGPQRGENGYRLYTPDDVAVLLRVRQLLDEGRTIGEIAGIGREQLRAEGGLVAQDASPPPPQLVFEERDPDLPWLILDALPGALVVTDLRGQTRWVNRGFSELCGYRLTDIHGRTPGSVLQGPATDRATVERIREAVKERRPCSERILNYDKFQRAYWASLDIEPLGVGQGQRGFVGLARKLGDDFVPASSSVAQALQTLARADRPQVHRSEVLLAVSALLTSLASQRDDDRKL